MKTIWKYPLFVTDVQIVEMPDNAHILCVQTQAEVPCLWALVNPDSPPRQRKILIAGTGHLREDLDGLVNYIGTFQMHGGVLGGSLVFHVFEAVIYGAVAAIEADKLEAVSA